MFTRRIVEYRTEDNILLHITPITPMMQSGLQRKAQEIYPDPVPPMREMPGGLTEELLPDKTDETYKQDLQRVIMQRAIYVANSMYRLGIDSPQRDALLDYYAGTIRHYKTFASVDDDWQALVECVILASSVDVENITAILRDKLPLEGGEIDAGMRIFRPTLEKSTS